METKHLFSTELVNLLDDATAVAARSLHQREIFPHLAVIAVGAAANSTFVKIKKERGRAVGVDVSVYELPADLTYADLEAVLNFANDDPDIHGVIVQLPLPSQFSDAETTKLLNLIKPEKDVDGLGLGQYLAEAKDMATLIKQAVAAQKYIPTTAQSIWQLAETGDVDWSEKVVVVGKGRLVGQPMHALLSAFGVAHQWVDKEDANCQQVIAEADVIVAGTNDPRAFLTDKSVRAGATVLAAGREADHYSLDGHVSQIAAERGGIGPLTVSILLANTVTAAQRQNL